jgi:hypothetical protein
MRYRYKQQSHNRRTRDDLPLMGQSLPNSMDELDKVILLHIPTDEFVVELVLGVDELCTRTGKNQISSVV